MSPRLQLLRVTPLERALWFVDGLWKFSPLQPEPKKVSVGRPRKENSTYGTMKGVARQFVEGRFGNMTSHEVAEKTGFPSESFKSTVYLTRKTLGLTTPRGPNRRAAA